MLLIVLIKIGGDEVEIEADKVVECELLLVVFTSYCSKWLIVAVALLLGGCRLPGNFRF